MLADGKLDELNTHMTGKAGELFNAAKADMDRLVAIQVKEAKAEYDAAEGLFAVANVIAIGALCLVVSAPLCSHWRRFVQSRDPWHI